MPSLVEIVPVVLKKNENEDNQWTDRQPTADQKSSLKLYMFLLKRARCSKRPFTPFLESRGPFLVKTLSIYRNCQSFSGEDENVESLQTDGQTDGRQIVVINASLSFQLRQAYNTENHHKRMCKTRILC